jgi:hypothetical protein
VVSCVLQRFIDGMSDLVRAATSSIGVGHSGGDGA